jgi:dihydrofolate reductase
MGKVIATTQATVDGVIDSVGEWVQPEGDHGEHSFELQRKSAGLLLGRKTWEGLAGFWPQQPESDKWAAMINPMQKYVGSRTLSGDLEWNSTVIEGDIETGLPALKDELDGDLYCHGSGEFAHALAEAGLVDEFHVYVNPLVYGGGLHVLGDRGMVRMELDDVTRFDSGVVLLTYRPAA